MKYIALLALILAINAANINLEKYTFLQYIQDFNKHYSQEELALRKFIFQRNLEAMIEHNKGNSSFKKGVNQFTDRTPDELKETTGYHKGLGQAQRSMLNDFEYKLKGVQLPDNFDWRERVPSVVTPVKNQGRCGSCWTFASAEAVESHWAIHTGQLHELSQQQIASCTSNPKHCGGHGGCSGGIAQLAFTSIIEKGGLASEWTYPYNSFQGVDFECKFNPSLTPPIAKLSGYTQIPTNNYEALLEALYTEGPISVSVDASTWHSYSSGVYDGCNTTQPDVNHAVLLVGYGVDPEHGPYWTIRNSWGPGWGEGGFIRIKRTVQGELCGIDITPQDGSGCDDGPAQVEVCGMCGILYDNVYPNVVVPSEEIEL